MPGVEARFVIREPALKRRFDRFRLCPLPERLVPHRFRSNGTGQIMGRTLPWATLLDPVKLDRASE